MTQKRLHTTGIVLLLFGFFALFVHFFARSALRYETEALSSRIDSLSIRTDNEFDKLKAERSTEVLMAELEDARGKLTGIKLSLDVPHSVANVSLFVYAGLMMAGSGLILIASRLPRT